MIVAAPLVIGCLLASISCSHGSNVLSLDFENFEHLTQAATGATTGDWFVEFYAPWCSHCKDIRPKWEALAEELLGEINVASVDCDKSPKLADRFKVKGYPTLIYFHHGHMFLYEGQREVGPMASFARHILEKRRGPEGVESERVPPEEFRFGVMEKQPWNKMLEVAFREPFNAFLAALAGALLGFSVMFYYFRPRGSVEEFADHLIAQTNKKKNKKKAESKKQK